MRSRLFKKKRKEKKTVFSPKRDKRSKAQIRKLGKSTINRR